MSEKLNALKKKLVEIFQLDQTDLDFGIYRIMNQKADEIQCFLDEKLLPQVQESFRQFKSDGQTAIQEELNKLVDTLKQAGMNPDESPKVKELKEKLSGAIDIHALENEVFSHLTSFFSRYYEGGDFLSLRRYKKDVYAIPYEGEEVKLHWANADQYYIKSSENFRDYSFKIANGKTVHFKLIDAETEKDNNKTQKDKERRFILDKDNPIYVENDELYIRFHYIADDSKKKQDKLNEGAVAVIAGLITKPEFKQFIDVLAPQPTEKNKKRTVLEKHLNDYTAKNSFDYFIHKDLGGFLRRELDFYIKNEVIFLDDLDEDNVKLSLGKAKTIKVIAQKIIDFLEQLENFQKKIWLKKKFVVDSGYCITLDNVPEELYSEIVTNKEQIAEWESLFSISDIKGDMLSVSGSVLLEENGDKNKKLEFLKQNQFLVLDTKFFNADFNEKLLASITDLDEQTDGLLINADNFHGLNLLQEKYNGQINGVYIDPPYNTDATEIVYKNGYKDSSWCSLINDRLKLGRELLEEESPLCVMTDECEVDNLSIMMKQVLINRIVRPVIIEYNHRGRVKSNFSITHEYALWSLPKDKDIITRKKESSEDIRRNLRRTGTDSTRAASPSQFYGIEVNKETLEILSVTKALAIGETIPIHSNDETEIVWPIDDGGIERRWYYGFERVLSESKIGTVWAKRIKGKIQIHYHQDGKPKMRKSVWVGKLMDSSTYGSELLNDIFGMEQFSFSFPKSIYAVKDCVDSMSYNPNAIIADYFAGSGTTGHAVINLNREDGGNRKYILIEMGEYFDQVTKPRIQKVVYSDDWKDGKPVSRKGSSHIFKYMTLESYEDALNNLKPKESENAVQALQSASGNAQEQYMLTYMMDFEYKDSLLNLDIFTHPFDYQMTISNGTETKQVNVNLVETFNYLIGLYVKNIYSSNGFKVVEGETRAEEKILIIWRDLKEKDNASLDELVKKLRVNPKDFEFDRIYVNGDNNLENLKLDNETWKVTLIEEEFKRRMFDVEDV
jgi:adenine-specific DNA-methyltransferase